MIWFLFIGFSISLLMFGDFSSHRNRVFPVFIVWVLLTLTAGLRGSGGYDYYIYQSHYYSNNIFVPIYEIGYCFLVWLCKQLGMSYNIFILVVSGTSILFLSNFYLQYCELPLLGIALYVGLYFIFYNMVLIRQMIAIVPLLYAIQSLAGNNYRRFFVLSVLGGLFHYSVLVVVPIMMILRPAKINIYLIMLIIISISVLRIIGLTGILGFLNLAGSNYLVDRLSRYILNNFRPKTIDYAKMFIMIFFIIFSYKYLKDNRYWQLWVKSYFVYILLFLSFGDYEIVYRISMYFELSITLIIPLVIKETIFMNDSKILFYFLSCFTLIFSILYRITSFDDGHFLDYKFFFAK